MEFVKCIVKLKFIKRKSTRKMANNGLKNRPEFALVSLQTRTCQLFTIYVTYFEPSISNSIAYTTYSLHIIIYQIIEISKLFCNCKWHPKFLAQLPKKSNSFHKIWMSLVRYERCFYLAIVANRHTGITLAFFTLLHDFLMCACFIGFLLTLRRQFVATLTLLCHM